MLCQTYEVVPPTRDSLTLRACSDHVGGGKALKERLREPLRLPSRPRRRGAAWLIVPQRSYEKKLPRE